MARIDVPIRGIAILDPDWGPAKLTAQDGTAIASDYTEADPEPGIAAIDSSGDFTLLPSVGGQGSALVYPAVHDAQSSDLHLRTVRAGFPAGWSYMEAGDNYLSDWRGFNRFNLSHAGGQVRSATGADTLEGFGVAVKPSTQEVMVVSSNSTSYGRATVWNPATRTWDSRGQLEASDQTAFVQVVYFEDTDMWVAFENSGSNPDRAFYSVDDGTSWSRMATDIYPDGLPGQARQTSLIDRFGSILVLTSFPTGNTSLHRSEDRGASFVRYYDETPSDYESAHMCQLADRTIVLVYRTSGDGISAKVLPDGYTDPDDVTAVVVAAASACDATATGYPVVSWVTPDDVIWVAWRDNGSVYLMRYAVSEDRGITWTEGTQRLAQYSNTAAVVHPEWMQVAVSGSEALLLHTAVVVTATGPDKSVWWQAFGGWSSLEVGTSGATTYRGRTNRRGFATDTLASEGVWFPQWEQPPALGWVLTGTAGTMSGIGLTITTSAATGYYTEAYSSIDEGQLYFWEVAVSVGGSVSANDCVFRVVAQDGTSETDIVIRHSTAGFVMYDNKAAANVGSAAAFDLTTTKMQFVLYFGAVDDAALYYKRLADSVWTRHAASASLTTSATAATQRTMTFGTVASSTTTSTWGARAFIEDVELHDAIANATPTTFQQFGAPLGSAPWPLRDHGTSRARAKLSARGGAARFGRLYEIEALGGGRVDHIFPRVASSPSVGWTGTDATQHDFVLDLRGVETRFAPSWAILVHVEGAGFKTAALASSPSTSPTFTTLGTINLATGFETLSYLQEGDWIYTDTTGNAGSRYVAAGELAGGYILTSDSEAVRIVTNSAGYWAPGATTLQIAVQLEDGTTLTGATVDLVWPRGVLVVPLDGDAADYARYWRWRIPAQTTPEAVLSLGDLFIGGVMVPGNQWDRGWLVDSSPNVSVREDAYGSRRTIQQGPNRRSLTVAWTQGHNATALRTHDGESYLSASASTAPVALHNDVRSQVDELFRYSLGGELPVVALMLDLPSAASTITDPTLFLSGWLEGSAGHEHVTGTEGMSEQLRTQSISITERK